METNIEMYEREAENFCELNKVAKSNGIVLFGSSFAKNIPVYELKQAFNIESDIYNRSLAGISIFNAEKLIDDCVIELSPQKVLLQLGETDLEEGSHTIPEIINEYEKIISKLRATDKHCSIVIVSICENDPNVCPHELNKELELMAHRTKCQYADISSAFSNNSPYIKAFNLLKFFMMDNVSFSNAMTLASI